MSKQLQLTNEELTELLIDTNIKIIILEKGLKNLFQKFDKTISDLNLVIAGDETDYFCNKTKKIN